MPSQSKTAWLLILLTICLFTRPSKAQYGGGTGELNNPYQITTAEDLMLLGDSPEDYDKHFILTADIDLDPNLPGRKVFDRALIAPDTNDVTSEIEGIPFDGVFDGNGHTISHLTIEGIGNLGLFGHLAPGSEVSDLHVVGVNITGSKWVIGGLVGYSDGNVARCYSTGTVSGNGMVGGLVGNNGGNVTDCNSSAVASGAVWGVGGLLGANHGSMARCYGNGMVSGDRIIGGLIGSNSGFHEGTIRDSHSDAEVQGNSSVGGVLGYTNGGIVVSCSSSGHVTGGTSVGGLIGQNRQGIATMCHSTAIVTGNGYNIGGLVGWNDGGEIEQCFAAGQIEGRSAVGGLVGFNYEDGYHVGWCKRSHIEFCYAQGVVAGSDKVGGLVGYNKRGTVYGCYSTGRLISGKDVGGLIGFHDQGPVRLCYWDIETSGLSSSAAGRGRTTKKLMMADTFVGWGDGVWCIDQGYDYPRLAWEKTLGQLIVENGPRYGGGKGILDDPYQIWTAIQLMSLAYHPEDYDKHFTLMADLDLSTIDPNKIVPIGMEFAPFTGIFEGNGHIVSNFVYESEDEDFVGLFGYLGPMFSKTTEHEGVIQNLHLVNSRILGKDQVGGIAGECSGIINACSVTGNIQGIEMIGGLVGKNWGIIKKCWTTVSVTGEQNTGALIGYHGKIDEYRPGLIHLCYTTGNVWGSINTGGLVGSTYGWIESCYSHAQATGDSSVGGLVGLNKPRGTIVRCYSTGPVTGSQNIGGLVGTGQTRSTFLSFWDIDTSGVLSSAGGRAKTTAQMFVAETFEGWGFSDDWTIDESSDYPHVAWENAPGTLIVSQPYTYGGGSGQPEDPYLIWTPEQFISITDHYEDFNKCFALMADIDMNSVSLDRIQPIGTDTIPFTGIFEGNYHTIHNLQCEANDEDGVGVFGYLGGLRPDDSFSGGTVKNLYLANVDVAGRIYVGGLAGRCYGGNIISCELSGRITGAEYVGGLVGMGYGINISSSSTSGTVDGGVEVGGLLGQQQGQVIQCSSACQVSGHEKLGGLIGSHRSYPEKESLLSQCTATGSVRGHRVLGGLVGDNGGIITNCYATVDVIGESYISDVGKRGGARTIYSYQVAGLVGANNGHISFSYSSADVEGHQEIGGLIGAQEKGEHFSCFWDVEVSEITDGVGNLEPDLEGAIGKTTAEMQIAGTFLEAGWDFVNETANGTEDIWWIDEGRDYPRLFWELIEVNQ
jgi:hypothetical protein